jgi:nucleotide-binding universal stress UspA family protein
MTYKTILVHCDASPKVGHRLGVAVALAQKHGAHLIGLHVRTPFMTPVFSDGSMPSESLVTAYEAATKTTESQAAGAFAAAIKPAKLSSEWRVLDGLAEETLASQSLYADLVVLGQTDPEDPTPVVPETVVLSSGRPALMVPHVGVTAEIGQTVLLCWNASRESARAAADALPILRQAKSVTVLTIEPASDGGADAGGAAAAAWLARQGVNATVQRDIAPDVDVGDVILSRAADRSVDLIVMGVYGHSRLREMVLGGASRTLLQSMTVPVLMAH